MLENKKMRFTEVSARLTGDQKSQGGSGLHGITCHILHVMFVQSGDFSDV